MGLDTLADVSEFVSAVAVVISLVYLAVQIRASSHQTRLANVQRMLEASREMMLVATASEFHCIRQREQEDPAALTAFERRRIGALRMAQMRNVETAFILHGARALDDDIFEIFEARAKQMLDEDPNIVHALHSRRFASWLSTRCKTTLEPTEQPVVYDDGYTVG